MTLFFSKDDQEQFKKQQMETYFASKFGFLNSHRGFRKGSVHLIIGNTSGGKSTLIRALTGDLMFHPENSKVHLGVWLSEETVEQYQAQLSMGQESNEALLRTEAFYELSSPDVTEVTFNNWVKTVKPDVLIIDNITTSKFYMDKKPDVQAQFAINVKSLAQKYNIAVIVVAHTDSSVNQSQKGYIELNQVRGSKQLSNISEFAYILQRFQIESEFFATIRIVKHRSQDIVHDLFLLHYDKSKRSYKGDTALEHAKFREAYEQRNKL